MTEESKKPHTFDPLDFAWPRMHAEFQGPDDDGSDIAARWEANCQAYSAYLDSVKDWPKGAADLLKDGSLHDAALLDIWTKDCRCLITLKQDRGAWDGRRYVAVLEYDLAAPVLIPSDLISVSLPDDAGQRSRAFWAYDQLVRLGDGLFRHYFYFDVLGLPTGSERGVFHLDFRNMKTNRFFLQPWNQER